MTESEATPTELWRYALERLQRSRVRPRLRAALIAYGQGETARPTAAIFGYADHRPITRAARRFGFDVLHHLHRDLRELERLAVTLGVQEPAPIRAARLAAAVEMAAIVTPSAPAKAG